MKRIRFTESFDLLPATKPDELEDYNRIIYYPALQVRLINGPNSIDIDTYIIDSGSYMCLFKAEIAEQLRIKWKDCLGIKIAGIGGKAAANIHNVTIGIKKYRYKIPVGFIKDLHVAGMLGHYGFLDRFSVQLSREKNQIKIEGCEDKGEIVFPPPKRFFGI